MKHKWFRRICFRLAFRGCKVNDPKAKAFVRDTLGDHSIEAGLTVERALELEYWARQLRS